jgi:hypothetical protein
VLKESLRFLDGGTRGFYCVAEGTGEIAIGDVLFSLQPTASSHPLSS